MGPCRVSGTQTGKAPTPGCQRAYRCSALPPPLTRPPQAFEAWFADPESPWHWQNDLGQAVGANPRLLLTLLSPHALAGNQLLLSDPNDLHDGSTFTTGLKVLGRPPPGAQFVVSGGHLRRQWGSNGADVGQQWGTH